MSITLPGEGETKLIRKTRVRRECENCGEPAVYRNTYLNDGPYGARRNPASAAFGKDDCSWCCDHEQYLCGECQRKNKSTGVPPGFGENATFGIGERFAHMFLEWDEEEVSETQAA